MRDFLDDIQANMDAGIGRAQQHARKELPKRFYKNVTVEKSDGGFSIALDGRFCKTPAGKKVEVPSNELAEILSKEWLAQEGVIDARTMPLVRLINSALEGGHEVVADLRDEVVKFAANDLLLYRAEDPIELVEIQNKYWNPVLTSLEKHFSVIFEPVSGIIHRPQPEQSLAALNADLANVDYFVATALVSITGLTGSGLLAFALRHNLIADDAGWKSALVDEDFNAERWGKDPEAILRHEKRRVEFDAALKVLRLLDKV
ncbi:hypothetical protein MNBD_ALPHA11-1714 [hydrothermal vent metagenome]|uniref:Chaperone required for the assembly of the mitochondrial F1-ATPase n=2 Tax=hydrothermal vent metagenome TaxID=652676 RepID=A0A3B0UK15_9ZZZZ